MSHFATYFLAQQLNSCVHAFFIYCREELCATGAQ